MTHRGKSKPFTSSSSFRAKLIKNVGISEQWATALRDQAVICVGRLENCADIRRVLPSSRSSGCPDKVLHPHNVVFMPSAEDAQFIRCFANSRTMLPDKPLKIVQHFRNHGYRVVNMQNHACGCTTFDIYPRSRPR
jgi:hypothetical protein